MAEGFGSLYTEAGRPSRFRPYPEQRTACGSAGAPNLKSAEGVENEHTVLLVPGCKAEFTTTSYGKTTFPLNGYEIATGRCRCQDEDMKDRRGRIMQTLLRVDALSR